MKQRDIKTSAIITGILVIAAGIILYLFNMGIFPLEYKSIVFSWQSLLIAIGFTHLFSNHKWFFGALLILVGGYFLLPELNFNGFGFTLESIKPIALIAFGILVVAKAVSSRSHTSCNRGQLQDNTTMQHEKWQQEKRCTNRNQTGSLDRNYFFSGSKEKLYYPDFKGGEINCIFGGMELDLSESQLAEGVHTLVINSAFGGIVLYVPIDWNIEIRQSNVFGNFADNRPKPGFEIVEDKTLILQVASLFGGGEIKCKNQ